MPPKSVKKVVETSPKGKAKAKQAVQESDSESQSESESESEPEVEPVKPAKKAPVKKSAKKQEEAVLEDVPEEVPEEVEHVNNEEKELEWGQNVEEPPKKKEEEHPQKNRNQRFSQKPKYNRDNRDKKDNTDNEKASGEKTFAKYNMNSGKRVGVNKNSQALKFSYSDYDNVGNPVYEVSTEDLVKVLIARSFKDGQMTLKRSLEYVLRALHHECNFPSSNE